MEPQVSMGDKGDDDDRDDSAMVKQNIQGFELNDYSKVVYVSPELFDQKNKQIRIVTVKFLGGVYYAYIYRDDVGYSIIKQNGEIVKGFEHIFLLS